jgi:RNA polymerase sigma-70 factor (ECF subfamily)
MPKGSVETFQSVFDRHFGEVYSYVAYRLAPDGDAAQDVTQEVFLAAWQSWGSYRGDGLVLSWLRGIARRKVADHLRIKLKGPCPAATDYLASPVASTDTDADERPVLLAQAMRLLPAEYAELLEEKYLEGLSVCQISQQRGRTEKAIESALSRARDLLRTTFQRLQAKEEICDDVLRP